MIWKNKRVFITGITGFKGSWLAYWLNRKGAIVCGIGLEPENYPNMYSELKKERKINVKICDILNYKKTNLIIKNFNPQILIHMAAQPIVLKSYVDPTYTFNVNTIGTLNILNICRLLKSLRIGLFITSDKVYENKNLISKYYSENSNLGGDDPYSASKAASEIIIKSYYESYFKNTNVKIATLRAGNVIGGGDWSENRILPDLIRSWKNNIKLKIRNPKSSRPWQHVLDTLNGYISLSEKLWFDKDLSGAYNIGPNIKNIITVKDLIKTFQKNLKLKKKVYKNIKTSVFKEKKYLNLSSKKIEKSIGFKNKLDIDMSVWLTCNWYKEFYNGSKIQELVIRDIKFYESIK